MVTSFPLSITYFLYLLHFWESKVKCGALSHSTLGPDSPAMADDDALHICQSNTVAFKFVLGMETLEYAEEFIHIFHIKAYSIVRDGTSEFISIIFASDPDFSLWTSTC